MTQNNSSILIKGQELYSALRKGDAASLQILLSSDFQGRLASGLPCGLGRQYDGREDMMAEAWGAVDLLFDLDLKIVRLFDTGEVLIGRGFYEGHAKTNGRAIRAAFAHFWQFDGLQFRSMEQITDTALWHEALK